MADDVTEQARDVMAGAIEGAFECETALDLADVISTALAAAGLVIAPINPTAEMLHSGCGNAPDRQLLSRAIWGAMVGAITSPASPSPAAGQEPEAADPYDATMAAASEYGEPKGPSSR